MLQTSLLAQTYKGRGGRHMLPLMYGGINFLTGSNKNAAGWRSMQNDTCVIFCCFFSVKTPWHGAEKPKQPAHDFKTITIFKITANQITINKI